MSQSEPEQAGQTELAELWAANSVFAAALAAVEAYVADADARCGAKVLHSMEVVDEALARFPDGELALSFNGGKDCHVMLILLMAAYWRKTRRAVRFPAVYVKEEDSFPQVDQFVAECARLYQLQVHTVEKRMKDALTLYLNDHVRVRGIFVGIRRQDPYGEHLQPFQRTDHGWPDFERVHPILEWDYGDVWDFLLRSRIAYCGLYDLGYTSLGGVSTTTPNPDLRLADGTYEPAFKLRDYTRERSGRCT